MSQTTTERFNLLTLEALTNPYPVLQDMRQEEPIYWSDQLHSWVLTRFRDVQSVLRDPRSSVDRSELLAYLLTPEQRTELEPLHELMRRWPVFRDPPSHTRVRSLIAGAVTPRAIATLRPRMEALANELINAVAAKGHMDLMADFAQPFATVITAEMLGANPADRPLFKSWLEDIEPLIQNRLDYESQLQVHRGISSMTNYFRRLLESEPERMKDTMLGGLINMRVENEQLSLDDALGCTALFMFAGQPASADLIALSILTLGQYPDQLAQLVANPTLIPAAIEEVIRFDGPILCLGRTPKEPMQIDSVTIQPGQSMLLHVGAANRDPEQFPDPERFDINRPEPRHVGFGHGAHYCIGSALARLEGQVALEVLLRRLPNLRLGATPPQPKPMLMMRSLHSLHVEFDPVS
ncbi:MAG: cytochrome P450 [Roseiflexaceae bacterium]